MSRSYFVYILASERNGTLYIGVTNDLVRCVCEHKAGQIEGFTKKHDVKRLVWFGETSDINAAIEHEKRMKKWRRAYKLRVIEEMNPRWRDLYDDLIKT